jgi:fumarylacetoacetate (FAA) hydrolase
MRLATVFDTEINEPRPVFELPGGQRIELRELFRAPGVADTLDDMPLYFTDLATTVQHLDDVLAAVRAWATQRAEASAEPLAESSGTRATTMPFCPPIPSPRTFRAFNAFEDHAKTARARRGQDLSPAWYDEPAFSFANTGSLIGHEAVVQAPRNTAELDFALELGLIIGTGGRNIGTSDAWNHVAGFTIVNALCARDLQRRELTVGMGTSKGRDFATAVGPYLVTLDALRDRIDSVGRIHLNMTARLNGKIVSRGDAASMYFSWPTIIEHASRDTAVYPGDLISSGTVGGGCILEIGPDKTGGWLKGGDVVELEIERLGVLRTSIDAQPDRVRAEPESCAASALG